METRKIVIIGAGISGLSAGIYARLNEYDVTILEMGQHAGGVCTSWRRDGYYVNGSLHWLIGSAPGSEVHDMWKQLGVIEDSKFYYHNSFVEYRDLEGTDVHFYTDIDKLRQHFSDISPQDSDVIEELCSGVRTLAEDDLPFGKSFELLTAWDWTKFMLNNFPVIMAMGKFTQMTVGDFAEKFRSRVLKAALENFWSRDMSMIFFLLQLAFASKKYAGYMLGGSGEFTEKLVRRFTTLGGRLTFGQKAARILIDGNTVIGVETSDGAKHFADYVIAACDGRTVLFDMLDEKYIDHRTRRAYQSFHTFPSLIYFSGGINRTFDDVRSSIMGLNLPLRKPVKAGNHIHSRASFQLYSFDPQLSPPGKTLITAMLHTDYDYWRSLYDESLEKYHAEQASLCDQIIKNLEPHFPGITALVDFTDMATPITYQSLTGNYKGSYEGWLPTPEALRTNLPSHFKTLKNFYMAGHWVKPGGGMPPAAFSGRDAIHLICRDEKRHFNTEDLSTVSV